jgi:cytoskeleton protein RodZ
MTESEQTSEPEAPGPPPPPPPPPATLGEQLRAARLNQDLTVEQLSTELRIEAKQLRALEENRFEQIGVPVFVKGYLKQYGTRLGLNTADLLAHYYKQTTLADVQVQPSRTITLRDERQITSWVLAAIVLLAVIAGLAVWLWKGGNFKSLLPAASTPAPAAEAATTTVQPAPARTQPEAARPAPVPEQRPVPIEDTAPAVTPAAPSPDAAADTDSVTVAPDEGDDLPADGSSDGPADPAAAVALQLVFDAESWAEITDARGERLLFGLNTAGRDVTVRGVPPFSIVLGSADSVRLTVDGAPYTIPRTGRQGNLARFSVEVAEE